MADGGGRHLHRHRWALKLANAFTGPVLFEGVAAPQLVAELLADELSGTPARARGSPRMARFFWHARQRARRHAWSTRSSPSPPKTTSGGAPAHPTRCAAPVTPSSSAMWKAMASPSRSGSVAISTASAFLAALLSFASSFALPSNKSAEG